MTLKPPAILQKQNTIGVDPLSRLLRLYFLLAAFEGLGAFVFLLFLPSDTTNLWLSFSRVRWVMLSVALSGALLFASLFFASRRWSWLARLAGILFERRGVIPNLMLVLLSCVVLLSGWLLIFHTQLLLELNEAYLERLAPFLVWGLLLAAQLGGLWIWQWRRPQFTFSMINLDISLLLAIWVISMVSRALLTGYGLPYQSVWDEVVTYPQALDMLTTPGLRPYADVPGYGRNAYGDLMVYINAGAEVLGLMEGFRSQEISSVQEFVSPPRGVATVYQAVHEFGIPLRLPRLVFAFINSLMPPLLYLILRRFCAVDPWSATGAALILGFLSRDFLYYSSYILPDALAVTLFVCLLLIVWQAVDSPAERWIPWLAAGFFGGLIISVNIRLVVAAGFPFLALVFSWRPGDPSCRCAELCAGLRRFLPGLCWVLFSLPHTHCLIYPIFLQSGHPSPGTIFWIGSTAWRAWLFTCKRCLCLASAMFISTYPLGVLAWGSLQVCWQHWDWLG